MIIERLQVKALADSLAGWRRAALAGISFIAPRCHAGNGLPQPARFLLGEGPTQPRPDPAGLFLCCRMRQHNDSFSHQSTWGGTGNMAVLVTVPKTAVGTGGTTAGQMDFIVWTSIDYGLTRVGGPVLYYDDRPDLSAVDELCIVGHGSPGQIERRSATDMAKMLTEGPKSVPDSFRKLIVTSCYAGVTVGGQDGTAVIDVIAAALRRRGLKGIEISGAMGPSIKANELGEVFKAVKSDKLGTAGPIQDRQIINHNLGVQNKDDVTRYKGTTTDPKLAEQAAKMMAKISGQFYRDFVDELEKERALFAAEQTMRTVYS